MFNAGDAAEAKERVAKLVEKYRRPAPKLADWIEANLHEGLTVFTLPEAHRRRLRTVNGLERLNGELRRRTRVATLFPNEASLLRLVSAMAAEISESGRPAAPTSPWRASDPPLSSYRNGVAQSSLGADGPHRGRQLMWTLTRGTRPRSSGGSSRDRSSPFYASQLGAGHR